MAEKSLEKARKNKAIQGFCGGVFWERNTLNAQQKLLKEHKEDSSIDSVVFEHNIDTALFFI